MEGGGWTSVSKLDCLEWVDDVGLKGAKTSAGIDARAGGDVSGGLKDNGSMVGCSFGSPFLSIAGLGLKSDSRIRLELELEPVSDWGCAPFNKSNFSPTLASRLPTSNPISESPICF